MAGLPLNGCSPDAVSFGRAEWTAMDKDRISGRIEASAMQHRLPFSAFGRFV